LGYDSEADNNVVKGSMSDQEFSKKTLKQGKSLRTLQLVHDPAGASTACTLDLPLLESIGTHGILTVLKVTLEMNRPVLSRLLIHVPPQLKDLHISTHTTSEQHPKHCERSCDQMASKTNNLGLQKLVLRGTAASFLDRMLILLLERSPEIKQPQFTPLVDEGDEGHRYAELALAVNSSCHQLDTLILDVCGRDAVPIRRLTSFLRLLTRGLRSICLLNEACQRHERIEQEYQTLVPRTLFTTPSMDTIQVLNLCATTFYGSEVSQILQSCQRLRELGAIGDASFTRAEDVSLLLDNPGSADIQLEVLEMSVMNLDNITESDTEQEWC